MSPRFIVLQWNDYRKENFLAFLGGFSSIQKAREVQFNCLELFKNEGWIASCSIFSRPVPSLKVDVTNEYSKNLLERSIVKAGIPDEPEDFTVDIFYLLHPRKKEGIDHGLEQVKVETLWGGWSGLNRCFVEEEITPTMLSELTKYADDVYVNTEISKIDLSDMSTNPDKDQLSIQKNQRCDYKKNCVHRYEFTYAVDREYEPNII